MEGQPQPDSRLTSFLAGVRREVCVAAQGVLGVSPEVPVEWLEPELGRGAPRGSIGVRVGVRPHQLPLYLWPADRGREAWVRGRHLALGYGHLDGGGDPFGDPSWRPQLERIRSRVEAADAAGVDAEPLRTFWQAMSRYEAFAEVQDWMFRYSTPREAFLRLGFRCNQDCGFCWQKRTWPEPPAEMYFTWLDELGASGRTVLTLSGGEPTLHPKLDELIARATSRWDMTVSLQTNAIQFAKPAFVARMRAAGLRGLFVSYHSMDAATSDAMTRAPGTHVRTVDGIRAALAAGFAVGLNCVITRANVGQLVDLARHIVAEFVRPFPDNPVQHVTFSHPTTYYDPELWRRELVALDELQPGLGRAIVELKRACVAIEATGTCGFPPCAIGDDAEALHFFPVELADGFDRRGRFFPAACGRCVMRDRCLGVRREYLEALGDRGVRPFLTPPG